MRMNWIGIAVLGLLTAAAPAAEVDFAKAGMDKARLERIAMRMVSDGADAVILGCTELPLLFRNSSIRTIDTIQVLAEALVREACSDIIVRGGVTASTAACGAAGPGPIPGRGPTSGGALG